MKRRGTTLIEVLAGVALLGSLLVAILVAKGRYADQWVEGRQRLEAVEHAETLLTAWWRGGVEDVPRDDEGELETRPGWRWRTQVVDDEPLEDLDAQVVRLEIVDAGATPPRVVTAVEFVLPPRRPNPEDQR